MRIAVEGPVIEVLVLQLLYAITAGRLINAQHFETGSA